MNDRLSDARWQEIWDLRVRGATYAEIGVRFGISRQRVHQYFEKHGVIDAGKVERLKVVSALRESKLRRLWEMGLTDIEIAHQSGYSPPTVRRWRNGAGLPCFVKKRGCKIIGPIEEVCRRMYDEGYSYLEIGKVAGVGTMTVWNWARREGLNRVDNRRKRRNGND
jgi:DNA-binding CsgD family transcriptional regulator